MDHPPPSLHSLQAIIGTFASLQGNRYRLIEIIEEPLSVVLEAENYIIQGDVHGNAKRQAKQTLTIPVFDQDKKLSDFFQELKLI